MGDEDRPGVAGSVVVVTGSSSGIGLATAAAFLRRGALVAGFDVAADPPSLQDAAADGGGEWLPLRVDIADGAAVAAAVQRVVDLRERVDVLVHSAALSIPQPFAEIDEETWDRVMAVNVKGAVLCLQAVLPGMVQTGAGSVVVLSSIAGRTRSLVNGAHYTSSKYGLIGLVRHLAAELAGTGVRINCVAPGPTRTPALDTGATTEEQRAIIERTPLRRLAEAEDVADAVLFMASRQARHVHGAVLDVNGGLF